MNCWIAKRRSTSYIDGRLRERERVRVAKHLNECQSCSNEFEQMRSVRSTLHRLSPLKSPAHLRVALQVAASRERQAIAEGAWSRVRRVWNRWLFRLEEAMRPITLPATGGLVSSILLFGALSVTIGTTTRVSNYEVPIMYEDHWGANLVPVQLRSSVVLTLNLDGKGRITDYEVRDGADSFVGDTARLQYNNITVPDFPSVLAAAQPISRGISISFTPIVYRQ
jgi:predicted anti-sigma-YlaC factor YlaD